MELSQGFPALYAYICISVYTHTYAYTYIYMYLYMYTESLTFRVQNYENVILALHHFWTLEFYSG